METLSENEDLNIEVKCNGCSGALDIRYAYLAHRKPSPRNDKSCVVLRLEVEEHHCPAGSEDW